MVKVTAATGFLDIFISFCLYFRNFQKQTCNLLQYDGKKQVTKAPGVQVCSETATRLVYGLSHPHLKSGRNQKWSLDPFQTYNSAIL